MIKPDLLNAKLSHKSCSGVFLNRSVFLKQRCFFLQKMWFFLCIVCFIRSLDSWVRWHPLISWKHLFTLFGDERGSDIEDGQSERMWFQCLRNTFHTQFFLLLRRMNLIETNFSLFFTLFTKCQFAISTPRIWEWHLCTNVQVHWCFLHALQSKSFGLQWLMWQGS